MLFSAPNLIDSPKQKLFRFSTGTGFGFCKNTKEILSVEILQKKETDFLRNPNHRKFPQSEGHVVPRKGGRATVKARKKK